MKFFLDVKPIQLRNGCILATIAHAIFTTHQPELAHEQSWDGDNYNVQDSEGTLGTVTFASSGIVGAFFDVHSQRNPFSGGDRRSSDLATRLTEMPAPLRAVAENDTLQYLLQDYEGSQVPLITSCFWSEGDQLAAAEPWVDVFSNGAHLIQTQLKEPDEAIPVWRAHYDFSEQQVELLKILFERKLHAGESRIELNADEKASLLSTGNQGLDAARELLAEINLTVP